MHCILDESGKLGLCMYLTYPRGIRCECFHRQVNILYISQIRTLQQGLHSVNLCKHTEVLDYLNLQCSLTVSCKSCLTCLFKQCVIL